MNFYLIYYLFSGSAILLFILNNFLYFFYKKFCKIRKIQTRTPLSLKYIYPRVLNNFFIISIIMPLFLAYWYNLYTHKNNIYRQFIDLILTALLDDFYFYWLHRLLHTRFFYKHIHYIHHRAKTPKIMDYLYTHVLEWFCGSLSIFISIVLLNTDFLTIFIFVILRHLHEAHIHSGYNIPFLYDSNFMITVKDHDYHHEIFNCNYANSFNFWDKIFNTYKKK